jgi:hypothetical protein
MADSTDNASEATYNRAEYVRLLIRTDIPGALEYLDRCVETARADLLRRKLQSPPCYDTDDASLDCMLNVYKDYSRGLLPRRASAPAPITVTGTWV